MKLKGNLKGLATPKLKRINNLYKRKLSADEVVSPAFAKEIYELANEFRRMIGALVDREGRVVEVFVGQREILYLPDLGRYRAAPGRLRRLRLLYSDLSKREDPGISNDIKTDLQKLRLDSVVSIKAYKDRIPITLAHCIPNNGFGGESIYLETYKDISACKINFKDYIDAVEEQIQAGASVSKKTDDKQALLVGVYDPREKDSSSSMAELAELARTAGVDIADMIIQKRRPDPKTLLGKGKMEEVILHCLSVGAEVLIFDGELKPTQWRIITNSTELKVLDRSMLILDIFAQRAKSSEGRLQVELAQLKYNLPRLVEMDAGLSRLTGGIGGRGPGETKLEISRRRSRQRIQDLSKKLDKLGDQRELRRKKRRDANLPLVSILGYTNVGKSTLFNLLTGSKVDAENKLFATLEPAQRKFNFLTNKDSSSEELLTTVLSDTVGFIRDLPAELRQAFKATFEELYEASILIHVVDASDPLMQKRKQAVEAVLKEMELESIPVILVANKIDMKADSYESEPEVI
ncbi:MAG: GTPase HflX, partial [Bdellovibrionales bacterium]|nr:GTPase HflX [Bdellovibrionales bacterium]